MACVKVLPLMQIFDVFVRVLFWTKRPDTLFHLCISDNTPLTVRHVAASQHCTSVFFEALGYGTIDPKVYLEIYNNLNIRGLIEIMLLIFAFHVLRIISFV